MVVISLMRFVLYLNHSKLEAYQPRLWLKLFTCCSLTQAAIWGALFAIVNKHHALEPISYALMLVIAGVTSGAIPALSPVRKLVLTNLAFILLPIIVSCLLSGQYPLASLITVFLLTASAICISASKDYIASLKTELELKESQQQMDLLVDSINGVVWVYDIKEGKFNFVNRRAESIMGYTTEQWLSLRFSSLIHEEDRDILATAFQTDKPANESADIVCRLKRANGSYAWIRNIITLGDLAGNKPIAHGVFFDITASIEAAEENKTLQLRLQQGQKLEAIGQLAAGVAHEINTPIQYIGDNISFLTDSCQELFNYVDQCQQLISQAEQQQFEPRLTEQIQASADDISLDYLRDELPAALTEAKEGTERVADIVKAMKEFSHPGAKVAQRIDLSRAVNNSISMAKNEWKLHAKVEFTPDESLPLVECFAGELNQVLLNIIVNAAHAIQEKWPRGDQGLISINTRLEDNHVAIAITDNGAGMPGSVKQRIFDPFYTTKEVGKGSGQGMSIAYAIIVEQHGGEINIDSVEGEGTTFTLNLPLSCSLPDAA